MKIEALILIIVVAVLFILALTYSIIASVRIHNAKKRAEKEIEQMDFSQLIKVEREE